MLYPKIFKDKCGYNKSGIRYETAKVLRQYNSDSIFLLPEYSNEAQLVSNYFNDDKFLLVENDRSKYEDLSLAYSHMDVFCGRLDLALAATDKKFSAGHADLIGNVNSTSTSASSSTHTFAVIDNLKDKVADEACFAFTHTNFNRSAAVMLDSWIGLYLDVIDDLSQEDLRWLGWGSGRSASVNQTVAFDPYILIALKFFDTFGRKYKITPIDNIKYRSTRSGSTVQSKWMDRTTIHMVRGETDIEQMFDVIKNKHKENNQNNGSNRASTFTRL